jgi:predicted dinucleotide-binding enzyme
MKIGIIGAGEIGGTLTRRLRALGHEVAVANSRGPETLADLARETGAAAVTAAEAARGRELVIFSIPMKNVPQHRHLFDGVGPEVVVVDTCNYYPHQRDGRIEKIEGGMTEARWVATQLGRETVKTFNSINWTRLLNNGRPKGDPARIAVPVAGDDAGAKAKVIALIDELGFDGVDAGGLDDSWRQQPGTPCYGADMPKAKLLDALKAARPERKPSFSGRPGDPQRH